MSKTLEVQTQMHTITAEESSLIKVELVCADCKSGKHGCPGHWIGLGLEIWCVCTCVLRIESRTNTNDRDDGNNKQQYATSASKLETNKGNTDPKESAAENDRHNRK